MIPSTHLKFETPSLNIPVRAASNSKSRRLAETFKPFETPIETSKSSKKRKFEKANLSSLKNEKTTEKTAHSFRTELRDNSHEEKQRILYKDSTISENEEWHSLDTILSRNRPSERRTRERLTSFESYEKTAIQKELELLFSKLKPGVKHNKPTCLDIVGLEYGKINLIDSKFKFSEVQLGEPQIDIQQGGFKVISASSPFSLITSNVKTCVAVVAIGLDEDSVPITRGLAHFDGSDDLIERFLKAIQKKHKHNPSRIYLYVVGGTGNYHNKEILEQIKESKVKIESIQTLYNVFKMDENSNEFELHSDKPLDMMGFDLTVGITMAGGIYAQKDSLFSKFVEGDFRLINLFLLDHKREILNLAEDCIMKPPIKQRILTLLTTLVKSNPTEWAYEKIRNNFMNNVALFLDVL